MPEREDDLNPASDLAPFVDKLKQLAPQHTALSRDTILFEAGKAAAAPKLSPWLWPSLTGFFASISVVLLGFLITPSASPSVVYLDRERVVYVDRNPSEPDAPVAVVTPPSSSQTQEVVSVDDDSSTLADQLRLRNEVMRWGVDMLPKSTQPRSKPNDMSARDLSRWLNVPPGTFAIHGRPQKKPIVKPDPSEEEE